jgi:hypothetical protein
MMTMMSVKHLTLKLILYIIYIMVKNKNKNKNKCLTQEDLDDLGFDDTIDDLMDARRLAEDAAKEEEEEAECDEACQTEKSLYQLYQDRLSSLNCAQDLRTIERQLGNNPLPSTTGAGLPDIQFLKDIYSKLNSNIGGQTTVYSQFNTYQDQIDTILTDTRKQNQELNDELNTKDSNYEVNYRKSYYETIEIDKILYGQNIVILIYFIILTAYTLFMLFMKEKYKDFKFYIFSIVLFILPYYIIPTLVSIFFSIRDYINVLMKTSGPKNTYMNL